MRFASNFAPVISVSPSAIAVTTPPSSPGMTDIVVTNPDGESGTLPNGYTFVAPLTITSLSASSASTNGGTILTIFACTGMLDE